MIPLRDDNPTSTPAIVTVTLIVACALAFLWLLSLTPPAQHRVILALGAVPGVLTGHAALPEETALVPPALTVVTSMFLHGGWLHLIGNMLFLWIFGNNVEDSMGHLRFVLFYLVCGGAAVLAQTLPYPQSEIPMIGASGAVSGVLGAYLLLYPHARVLVLVPIGFFFYTLHLPAVWVLGIWFGLQLLNALLAPVGTPGVAWAAHVGGFVAGAALIPLFKHRHVRLFSQRGRRR